MKHITLFEGFFTKTNKEKIEKFLNKNIKVNGEVSDDSEIYWFSYKEHEDLKEEDVVYIVNSKLDIDCSEEELKNIVHTWMLEQESQGM